MSVPDSRIDWSRVALLTVWNPRVFPRTIEAHVEALKAAPADRPWTWWGRIYAGEAPLEDVRARWTWLPRLDDELEHREVMLYVTSFESLHVLRIDRIARTQPEQGDALPNYYAGRTVPLWFRVRDIKALQWSSFTVADALDALDSVRHSLVEPERARAKRARVDLFAARENYWPILVEVVDPERIGGFDGRDTTPSYLDPAVSMPADVESARAELSALAPSLWAELPDVVADSLASARLLWNNPRLGALDGSSAAIAMARALEILAVPVAVRQREALLARGRGVEVAAQLHEDRRAWKGDPGIAPTLGQLAFALPPLRDLLRTAGIAWSPIDASIAAIQAFAKHRNAAAHGRVVERRAVEELGRKLWPTLVAELMKARSAPD